MRIAVFVSVYPTLSETFIVDQLASLIDRGHEVSVFARMPPAAAPQGPASARVHYIDSGAVARSVRVLAKDPARVLRALAELAKVARPGSLVETNRVWQTASKALESGETYDVALAHFGPNGLTAMHLRQFGILHAPLATIFHGRDVSYYVKRRGPGAYRALFQSGELMLPVSEYFGRRLIELGCPAERIRVQRMGVDLKRFQYRVRTHTAGEPIRILSVCRLVEKKGIEFGLRALARLPEHAPPIVWDILGDGPERQKLEQLTAALGLSGRVTWHGAASRERVAQLFATHHVFLAPSITGDDGDQEGIPVAIMEAAACGLPVVSTQHSGIPELVRDGVSGYLAPERDVDGLAAALTNMLTHTQRWPAFAAAARGLIESDYERDAQNDRLAAMLAELADANTVSRAKR